MADSTQPTGPGKADASAPSAAAQAAPQPPAKPAPKPTLAANGEVPEWPTICAW